MATRNQWDNDTWTGLNAALVAGDKARALTYLTLEVQTKYGPVFDVLLPDMAETTASYSPLRGVMTSEHNMAKYGLHRTIRGETWLFLIYYLKDDDGVWQLDGM